MIYGDKIISWTTPNRHSCRLHTHVARTLLKPDTDLRFGEQGWHSPSNDSGFPYAVVVVDMRIAGMNGVTVSHPRPRVAPDTEE